MYDEQLKGRRHFHRARYAGANAAVMSRIAFPYAVRIKSLQSVVTTAHDTAGCGWKLRNAAGTDLTGASVVHGTDAAGTVRSTTGLDLAVAAGAEIQIYGIADSEVGVQEICIEYEIEAGQALR